MENYESFYLGGYSSLNPNYGNFIGYRLNAGQISSPTSIQTANQLNEVVSRIREGVKNVELQPLSGDVFDQIPAQHFKEIRALVKLSGVKTSVHAPMIDPVGFGEKSWEGEAGRINAERKLMSVVEKSHEIDPEGNIPVVIHSSGGLPGSEYSPDKTKKPGEEGRFREEKLTAVNQETGELTQLKRERKFYPGMPQELFEKGYERVPREDVASINATDWENKLTNLAFYKKHAEEIIGDAPVVLNKYLGKYATPDTLQNLSPEEQKKYSKLRDADIFLSNVELNFKNMFDKAYKFGTPEQKEELKKFSKEYTTAHEKIMESSQLTKVGDKTYIIPTIGKPLMEMSLLDKSINKLSQLTQQTYGGQAPKVFVPIEEFATDKAALTFGNVAFDAYKKFKNNAPIIAIENLWQGMAFSRPEQMKELVEKSKKVFVDNAVSEGYSEREAKKQADKLIGVTWDTGHLNMMRKAGFKEEDVIKDTEKIAKLVKHVHLSDNFGYSDAHLPPGMGNVPFKQILEKLEKAGALKDAKMVVEAGSFVQHFKQSPHPLVLGAFGSGIYSTKAAPYWNQLYQTMGNYSGTPMVQFPERYFSTYGSSFSTLPLEIGGQIPGSQSRFSGTANA